jgi:sortase A
VAVTTAPDAPTGATPGARPSRPKGLRLARALGAVGRTFIVAGVIILLFVVYQLWGTGVITARTQDDLRDRFEAMLARAPTPTTAPSTTATTAGGGDDDGDGGQPATTTTTALPALAAPPKGDPLARIEIPTIGVDWIVVEGVDLGELAKGPGHYPDTPMPGQLGNVAIAGHRTTHGAPFYRVNELQQGDEILVTTAQGEFTYEVEFTQIVTPTQWEVVAPTEDAQLTLTSCNPRYSSRQRIVVRAKLEGEPAPGPPAGQQAEPGVDASGATTGTPHLVAQVYLDDDGGDPAAVRPSILLAIACAVVWAGFWVLGRMWRRWPAYVLGAPVFLAALFLFFTQFSRLLPASY